MNDYWYWEIKFHINFPSGKREGTYSVDRQNASTADLAQKELFIAYKEINITNGKHYEIGTNVPVKIINAFKLIISLVNNQKIYPKLVIQDDAKFDSLMDQRSFVANDVFCQETSWSPKVSLEEGLKKIISHSNISSQNEPK